MKFGSSVKSGSTQARQSNCGQASMRSQESGRLVPWEGSHGNLLAELNQSDVSQRHAGAIAFQPDLELRSLRHYKPYLWPSLAEAGVGPYFVS
jgi:hypothetical protein